MTESKVATGVDEALAKRTWLLVPSYLLGPEVWRGVAEVLEVLGQTCIVASPGRTTPQDVDHIGPWVDDVVAALDGIEHTPVVVCGYSAATSRLPLVVEALGRRGTSVSSMLMVNGRLPKDGLVPAAPDSPFMKMLDGLVRPDDYLPPWHRWWGSMIEDMLPDDEVRARVLGECLTIPREVFDQPIPAPELPASVGIGFLAIGNSYLPAYDRCIEREWPVSRVEGEHLDLVVEPVLVAGALLSLCLKSEQSTA